MRCISNIWCKRYYTFPLLCLVSFFLHACKLSVCVARAAIKIIDTLHPSFMTTSHSLEYSHAIKSRGCHNMIYRVKRHTCFFSQNASSANNTSYCEHVCALNLATFLCVLYRTITMLQSRISRRLHACDILLAERQCVLQRLASEHINSTRRYCANCISENDWPIEHCSLLNQIASSMVTSFYCYITHV